MVKLSEIKMFKETSHNYFEYMCKSFLHYSPTALAKILGAFKVKLRYVQQNKTYRYCVFMMENISIGINEKNVVKYDLKGSRRKRFIEKKKEGQVLLDNNFLFDHASKPICMDYVMKRLFQMALHNDTFYLSKSNVVDYSLLCIIDKERRLLRVGIIDYIQQYTLDKILESRFKKVVSRGEDPTIVDPEMYKHRFKQAMNKYFVALFPDQNANSIFKVTQS